MPEPRLRSIAPSYPVRLAVVVAWISGIAIQALAGIGAAPVVGGPADSAFDDPKLARELGTPLGPAGVANLGGRAAATPIASRVAAPVSIAVLDRASGARSPGTASVATTRSPAANVLRGGDKAPGTTAGTVKNAGSAAAASTAMVAGKGTSTVLGAAPLVGSVAAPGKGPGTAPVLGTGPETAAMLGTAPGTPKVTGNGAAVGPTPIGRGAGKLAGALPGSENPTPAKGTERATARPPSRDTAPKRLAFADMADGQATRSADIVAAHKTGPDVSPVAPEPSTGPWPYAPRMKLGYRRFPFARVASSAPAITPGTLDPTRPESFESLSFDLYPISWYLRVGLSTQFGWESGQFNRTGDYFFAESASVGFQIPGRFTPFVEALAGAGYMRRKQVDYELPTAYWQTGIDAGLEIYLASRMYVSLAAGYIHPGNLFLKDQSLKSVNADTWSLKIGLGI